MTHTFTGTVTRELTRQEKAEGSTWNYRRVKVGTRTARVNLQIDVDALINLLGGKAALAKTRKSRLQGGIILAEAVDITDVPVTP